MMIAVPAAAWFSSTPARSSRSAMNCRYWSIVSSTPAPAVAGRSTRLKIACRLASVWIRVLPSRPRICES